MSPSRLEATGNFTNHIQGQRGMEHTRWTGQNTLSASLTDVSPYGTTQAIPMGVSDTKRRGPNFIVRYTVIIQQTNDSIDICWGCCIPEQMSRLQTRIRRPYEDRHYCLYDFNPHRDQS